MKGSRTYLITIAIISLLILYSTSAGAQQAGFQLGYKIEGKDTVYQINIHDLYVFNRPDNFRKNRSWRDFSRMVYNFKKVYPYALLAKTKIEEADSVIRARGLTGRQKDKYIRNFENNLFAQFEKPLRKMTITQGKLLLKLIDREVGQSSYYLIKNYKGGFTAFFWQGIARIFGSDLKSQYDPFGKDKVLEELVQMYLDGSFESLYYSMYPR